MCYPYSTCWFLEKLMLTNFSLRHLCKGANLEMPPVETALHMDFAPPTTTEGPEAHCYPKIKKCCLLVTVYPTFELAVVGCSSYFVLLLVLCCVVLFCEDRARQWKDELDQWVVYGLEDEVLEPHSSNGVPGIGSGLTRDLDTNCWKRQKQSNLPSLVLPLPCSLQRVNLNL